MKSKIKQNIKNLSHFERDSKKEENNLEGVLTIPKELEEMSDLLDNHNAVFQADENSPHALKRMKDKCVYLSQLSEVEIKNVKTIINSAKKIFNIDVAPDQIKKSGKKPIQGGILPLGVFKEEIGGLEHKIARIGLVLFSKELEIDGEEITNDILNKLSLVNPYITLINKKYLLPKENNEFQTVIAISGLYAIEHELNETEVEVSLKNYIDALRDELEKRDLV